MTKAKTDAFLKQMAADTPKMLAWLAKMTPEERAKIFAKGYALGVQKYKDDPDAKEAIDALNELLYSKAKEEGG